MPIALERSDIEDFRSLVARQLGLAFEDGKLDYLAEILRSRMEATGCGRGADYLQRLGAAPESREEWRTLAERLTVAETYFFRYADHFRVFVDVVLPAFRAREIRILSAGCASGEEPYSLAILLREHRPDVAARILAVDVNPAVLEKAGRARYSPWSLRETPAELRERHFRPDGRAFVLREEIRSQVVFEERNLVQPDPLFWQEGAFDLVFCRNVTMYFPAEVSRSVMARIARSLVPGGYLFLGHAETLRGVSEGFHLRQTHGTFYYQRRDAVPRRLPEPDAPAAAVPPAVPPIARLLDSGESWFDVIQHASERIAALAAGSAPRPADAPASPAAPSRDLSAALDLLQKERFSEALSALPAGSERDPEAQLLRAVLLTNGGDLAGAKEACRRLLEADEFHAGAHYIMALCLEHEGGRAEAVEHDRAAAYLDGSFAMPRFHLGLLAKRAGRLEDAGRELQQALSLLAREDPSRILLFGGGFSREALVELCRAEIRACGGSP